MRERERERDRERVGTRMREGVDEFHNTVPICIFNFLFRIDSRLDIT